MSFKTVKLIDQGQKIKISLITKVPNVFAAFENCASKQLEDNFIASQFWVKNENFK